MLSPELHSLNGEYLEWITQLMSYGEAQEARTAGPPSGYRE